MKIYAAILLILLLIGAAMTVPLLTQEEKLDQTVFLETTVSIRNLQTLEKNLRLLLAQSRFNSRFDHDQLTDINYEISEEFDNLRFDALFEEIESSPSLSDAIRDFEKRFQPRAEMLTSYIDANQKIARGLIIVKTASERLQNNALVKSQPSLVSSLASNKTALFSLALGDELQDELTLVEPSFEVPSDIAEDMFRYERAVRNIREYHPVAEGLYDQLSNLDTGDLLNVIEERYASYHNEAIVGSNRLRNALIAYGVVLLLVLVLFVFQIRRNYLSLEQQVADRTAEIKTAYDDLQESQEQLIQSEKMASLGQMVAGVAHEINTPLGYVTSNIDTLKMNLHDFGSVVSDLSGLLQSVAANDRNDKVITEKMVTTLKRFKSLETPELMQESNQLLEDGVYGLSEISKLVTSLKDFARLDRQDTEQVDVHECIESSLTIASNHIRDNNVSIVKEFGDLPRINCFPSKLNQLFLNIITNACQAMKENGGELRIQTQHIGNEICLHFQDQGIGMDEQTKQKMFDPFFTSKPVGEGTGLGMSIAYKIVVAHNGKIAVASEPNQGTMITVILPIS